MYGNMDQVIRGGYRIFFDEDMTIDALNEEMLSCDWDTQAWMEGRVVNNNQIYHQPNL